MQFFAPTLTGKGYRGKVYIEMLLVCFLLADAVLATIAAYLTHMKTACEETRARGARTIVITDCPDRVADVADEMITIPNNGPLTALLASIPLQLLAYELACLCGINPDVPRNLAKAVTVD